MQARDPSAAAAHDPPPLSRSLEEWSTIWTRSGDVGAGGRVCAESNAHLG